jgi:hypothetical protein
VPYIIEPPDEEAETTRKRRVAAEREARFFGTNFAFSLTKTVEGCTLNGVIRPGRRRVNRLNLGEPSPRSKLEISSLTERAIGSVALNLHK